MRAPTAPRSEIRLVVTRRDPVGGPGVCYEERVDADVGDEIDPLKAAALRARDGDPAAIRRVLDAVGPTMLAVVRAVLGGGDRDVEDVLQDALVGVVHGLAAFRFESSVLHFARSIALRRALDQRRKRARLRSEVALDAVARPDDGGRDVEPEEALAGAERSPAASVVAARRREAFRALLEALRPEQAEAFAQRVLFGYSMKEIARQTGVPLDTVKSRLRLAKAALRARIQDDPLLLELSETDDDDLA